MRISVLVPTYRRPDDLRRCLAALVSQNRRPLEVVVVSRSGDGEAHSVIASFIEGLPLRSIQVDAPGQVAALNKGLDAAEGDIVAIIDDDTAPHPDWTSRIVAHFEADPKLTGLGGRDWTFHDGVLIEGGRVNVGLVAFFGRYVGNHHLGIGPPREVDILKGANMSYRVAHLEGLRFDCRLRGSGAQVCNDLAFSLALRRRGRRLIYDPAVAIDHHPSIRHDEDKREKFNELARRNEAFNQTLALLDFLPTGRRVLFLCWAFTIGTRRTPGIAVYAIERLVSGNQLIGGAFRAAQMGLLQGMNAWFRSR